MIAASLKTRTLPMEVFGFSDYREYVTHRIQTDTEGRGYQKKLAVAAGCQSSYLSQVLSSQANLTVEQAMGLCSYWSFDEDETEFFMTLVQHDRAGTMKLKEHLLGKMDVIRVKRRKLSTRFQATSTITAGQELEYYSTWYLPVIHTMIAIPGFRQPKSIAAQLNLELQTVEDALTALQKSGLAEKTEFGWTNTARSIHLKSDSPLNYAYHNNIRQLAGRAMQKSKPGENIHYSAVYSMSQADFDKLKQQMIATLEESRKVVIDSKEETTAVFALDFFKI